MITVKPLPMAEALEYWRSKVQLTPKEFYALADVHKARAFTVSRLARADMLDEIHASLATALAEGTSFNAWKKSLSHVWEENGWTGKAAWRVDNIFRTNIQTAYNVGRYKQMMEVAQDRPYWQYSAVNDSRTRPTHRALHGRVYRADSPFWDTFYPPNGFRCRCKVKTLSERQVTTRGLTVHDGNGLGELIEPIGPDGPLPARPLMPDRGFEGNPGKEAWQPDLSKYPDWLRAKLETVLGGAQFIKFRWAKDLADAKALTAEMGVHAEYDSVSMGNYVNAGLAEAKSLGLGTPRSVRVAPEAFQGEGVDGVMAYLHDEDALLLNPRFGLQKIKRLAKELGGTRDWSSDEDMHAIRHEMGHAMAFHAAPLRYDRLRFAKKLNSSVQQDVASEVSIYAADSPLELVAEVYAGLRAGKTYSVRIMRLYRAYGGQ